MLETPLPIAPAPIIDIGANLTNSSFDTDLEEVLERARAAGISHLLITGVNLKESIAAAKLAEHQPALLSSTAGCHPHHAKEFEPQHYRELQSLSELPQVKAIGECGLDFNRMFSPEQQQIAAFERQIELAIEQQLPLFLHERDAHQRQWEILAHYRDHFPGGVVHCFTGAREQAFHYLDLDLHLGITGWICDERRGSHLHEFIGHIPLDRLLLETDAPYLMPRVKPTPPLSSNRRNEPCTLPYVLEEIARHHSASSTDIALATTENAKRLFSL